MHRNLPFISKDFVVGAEEVIRAVEMERAALAAHREELSREASTAAADRERVFFGAEPTPDGTGLARSVSGDWLDNGGEIIRKEYQQSIAASA